MKKLITAILLAAMLISLVACGGNTGTESSDSDSHTESDDSSVSSCESSASEEVKYRVLTKSDLTDKIRGSWAGQMYGVTWGAPTEFRYCGQIVPEDAVPDMSKLDINHGFNEDDLYVELTYVEEMRKSGYNCSVEQLAKAFAESTYPLDHANKYGRDNVKAGIMPPLSGSPEYNIRAMLQPPLSVLLISDTSQTTATAYTVAYLFRQCTPRLSRQPRYAKSLTPVLLRYPKTPHSVR